LHDLDRVFQAVWAVAFLLYLTPIVWRSVISEKGRRRFQRAGFVVFAAGMILTGGATILWFLK
jgi:hypothetical protein